MIEINLLPEELSVKKEKEIPLQLIVYGLVGIFALILIVHLFLLLTGVMKIHKLKSLEKRWTLLTSQHPQLEAWRKQYATSSQETQGINKLLKDRLTVFDKMQVLSKVLPNGIWFNQITLKDKNLRLEGCVISLKKDHLSLLNLYLSNLKKERGFFQNLELGSVKMRSVSGYEIMDFILTGKLQ